MANDYINMREELYQYRVEFGLRQEIPCSKQENKVYAQMLAQTGKLPDGVFPYVDDDDGPVTPTNFYIAYESNLTDAERLEYLTYKKLSYIKDIKKEISFISLVAAAFWLLVQYFLNR